MLTNEADERVKMPVNSCVIMMDRVGMRVTRECSASWPRQGGCMHSVNMFKGAVTVKKKEWKISRRGWRGSVRDEGF